MNEVSVTELALRLWAKSDPRHELWKHMLDTAAVCRAVLPRFGKLPELTNEEHCLLVALHDIGKADPYFQCKAPEIADEIRELGFWLPEAYGFRHEWRSSDWLRRQCLKNSGWQRSPSRVVDMAIANHHGRSSFKPDEREETRDPNEVARWEAIREFLAQRVSDAIGASPQAVTAFSHTGVAALKLAGLVVLCDWIASNSDLYRYELLPKTEDARAYFAAACNEAGRVVRGLGLSHSNTAPPSQPARFAEVFPDLPGPRPLQQILEDAVRDGCISPGLVLIEDGMGQGKTEAAEYLIDAWSRQRGRRGAYLALPTAATSNQMHGRYRDFLTQQGASADVRLVHGMAWLIDPATPEGRWQTWGDDGEASPAPEWFRPSRRALLAPEAVGTIDQALLSVLRVKYGFLRLLGLSNKVLLIDEVHAYDSFMGVILTRLLQWCRAFEIPVILLSATLSRSQKQELLAAYGVEEAPNDTLLPAYPLVTWAGWNGQTGQLALPANQQATTIRIEVAKHYGLLPVRGEDRRIDASDVAGLAVALVESGGCLCVLCNTVDSAQAVFQSIRAQADLPADTQTMLFHARFAADVRTRIEEQVVSTFGKRAGQPGQPARPVRAILVATQVVEQSLDVDFDVMISEVAPIDLLLQRCGRVHRHAGRERGDHRSPTLHVLLPAREDLSDASRAQGSFGATGFVYKDLQRLALTCAVLESRTRFDLPDDFRRLIGQVYDGDDLEENSVAPGFLEAARQKAQLVTAKEQGLATVHLLPRPKPGDHPLETAAQAVQESEEGESADFFHARTRLGDLSTRVILPHTDELLEILSRAERPGKRLFTRLMLRQASIPRHWLADTEPEPGWEPPAACSAWLKGYRVLPLHDGVWRGVKGGSSVVIREDADLGLVRAAQSEENVNADL